MDDETEASKISIHASARRATSFAYAGKLLFPISIHASARRATV